MNLDLWPREKGHTRPYKTLNLRVMKFSFILKFNNIWFQSSLFSIKLSSKSLRIKMASCCFTRECHRYPYSFRKDSNSSNDPGKIRSKWFTSTLITLMSTLSNGIVLRIFKSAPSTSRLKYNWLHTDHSRKLFAYPVLNFVTKKFALALNIFMIISFDILI